MLTHRTRADFDNLHVSPTQERSLFFKGYTGSPDFGRPFSRIGGTWVEPPPGVSNHYLKQTNTEGTALAIAGVPVTDQRVVASIRLDSYGSTQPVPWFGLLARYVDERNYYYLSVRGSDSRYGEATCRTVTLPSLEVFSSGLVSPIPPPT